MKNLLADSEWLIRLDQELQRNQPGPASELLENNRVHVNTVSVAEFLSGNPTVEQQRVVKRMRKLPLISYGEASLAAKIRRERRKQGKTMGTADAFMAAGAMVHDLQLVTGDRDYSGIPGLDWASYKD